MNRAGAPKPINGCFVRNINSNVKADTTTFGRIPALTLHYSVDSILSISSVKTVSLTSSFRVGSVHYFSDLCVVLNCLIH